MWQDNEAKEKMARNKKKSRSRKSRNIGIKLSGCPIK